MGIRHLEVGQLFEPGKTRYQECIKFECTQSGPMLLMFFDQPSNKEVDYIKSGKFQTKFYEYEEVIFMLFKFGSLSWIDAPYSVHLSQPFEFAEELEQENIGLGLQIYLIDATTGILKAMRLIGLGHDYSLKLRDAILKQKGKAFDLDAYDFKISEIYKRYNTDQLADFARWYYKTEN